MKIFALLAILGLGAAAAVEKDRTITKVVKLLQGMLDKSQAEGDEERTIYSKFKCYCDTSEAEKTASIKTLTEQISLLESEIEETQGDTGGLSSECADLKAQMADNKAGRDEATTLRNKQNKAFIAQEKDLEQGILQMKQAIETLSKVGADQTESTGADNKQFMAGKKASLVSVQAQVQAALHAAVGMMSPEQQRSAAAFLQGPFTGTYTSQSAQVMGIIKSMRDTFKTNLEDARVTEKTDSKFYNKFMKVKNSAFREMEQLYEDKQKALSGNDQELSSKKSKLSEAQKQLKSDQEFMDSLLPMCAEKAKGYGNRKLLRANEEAAIAEAVSILNSDEAFSTFGTASATKTGSTAALAQRSAVHRHLSGDVEVRHMAELVLQKATADVHSARLSTVLALLQAENPFGTVLDEIKKMIDLSKEEGEADQKKLDWCNKERTENDDSLSQKKRGILGLERGIDQLTKDIQGPKTGLKALIQETEERLVQNKASQTTQTSERTEANVAYQKDVRNLVSADGILTKALKVLKAYYDDLEKKLANGEAFVQKRVDSTQPEGWKGDGDYKGQSSKGGDVMQMLEFILSETRKEETATHAEEEKSQAQYEDSMTQLKKEEAGAEKSLVDFQETLAEKEKDLLDNQADLKDTTADKEAIEVYLEKIKPGCDFITTNFDLREENRKTETQALEKAVNLIKGTPAYKTAVNSATVESYGDCKEPCVKDASNVKCKACKADVTIPAYCAGHKGAKGC